MRSQTTFEREPARRVFAAEFRETRYQFKDDDDEKSPTYVIFPTGIRSNRVFIVGTLTEKQRQGDQNVFYRGRVVDPTGTFFIMAGSYQPEAMQQLARIEPPAFVAVVGKPNLFTTQDGNCLVSVRTESITVVDRETRDLWVLDTARSTLDRLDAFGTTDDSRKAMEEYGTQVPHVYRKIVYEALTQVQM
ncbi:MAG TPA: nucleic acid-binding protein [Methanoculleus sp.]|jgi:RPA family protein|nr:nucleic acid-binding protein [Methanoculleus sp.]HOB07427.1 nucleic acid-binding protein [Methanoculleus sp.]HPZ33113.1 nucleic acid-binding protein [Methanoculleus sp.]HQD24435.1 nucleic acid-binding protein [Methanoculleus sp.]HQN90663.1 nucleic acid-binding protein [Methanoculleus sp.]